MARRRRGRVSTKSLNQRIDRLAYYYGGFEKMPVAHGINVAYKLGVMLRFNNYPGCLTLRGVRDRRQWEVRKFMRANHHEIFIYLTKVHRQIRDRREMAKVQRSPRFGYVYLLKSTTGHYKIGKSKTPRSRISSLGVVLPFDIEVMHLIACEDYHQAEKHFHRTYADVHVRGEWFALEDYHVWSLRQINIMYANGKELRHDEFTDQEMESFRWPG